MPYRDGTGPLGQGPITGRGTGLCTGPTVPRNMNPGSGWGFGGGGQGRGGRGWRHQFHATGLRGWQRVVATERDVSPISFPAVTREQGLSSLKIQVEELQTMLEQTRKKIEEIEAASAQK